ncbi:MAG: 1-deoxy-D-xylulose-5-phosphate reductoisomerase [Treponema sp.]|nr:1-deoxy-D-xylulose-5-phosphate reductoisomerase [Treponema sp.]
MCKKKRIALLGATGSIGKSSIDIILRDKERFEVVLLTARSNSEALNKISNQFPGAACVLAENNESGLLKSIAEAKPDITINGVSGAAGLLPSVAAINSGSDLALANKETIVMAGNLVMKLAKEKNVNIIPVDSEHSAIFHLLKAFSREEKNKNSVNEIILTASGGPFRNYNLKELENAALQDALSHPTWNMGAKITIDSASMANKGLEIIEACKLFNISHDKIKVVIHPQSIVHSMIRLSSGVIYAQLSKPDMRHPVHDALYWPEISPVSLDELDFDSLYLQFSKPDLIKFPMLSLAREAAAKGSLFTCAYNAANEVAVSAFLERKIKFTEIPVITAEVLKSDWNGDEMNLEAILNADFEARQKAMTYMKKN